MALGWTNGDVRVIDVSSGADAMARPAPTGGVHAVAWHPNGERLAVAGADRVIRVWEVPTGRLVQTLTGHTELVYSLDYSPDGTRLVSASTDQTVRLWAAGSGDHVLTIPFAVQVYGARFARDGARLAVMPMDGSVVLLDAPAPAPR